MAIRNKSKKLGALADELYETREARLALQKQIDMLAAREKEIKDYLIDTLPKSDASGISGVKARVTIVVKEQPTVTDKQAFWDYINDHEAYELAQVLRPSAPAIKERWENGEEIPGIDKFNAVTVSINKV